MICHGDELGRTQRGNNNGYCQDNEITWIDWSSVDVDLLAFTRRVAELRERHPIFRRRRFFDGLLVGRRGPHRLPDIAWFRPDGSEMTEQDWSSGFGRSIGVFLNGEGMTDTDSRGQRVVDDSFLLYFNAHDQPIDFRLLKTDFGQSWQVILDTAQPDLAASTVVEAEGSITVAPRSLAVLQGLD
jgi:glycogen operon protein